MLPLFKQIRYINNNGGLMARKPTGKPNGRPVSSSPCMSEAAIRTRQWQAENKEHCRTTAKERYYKAKANDPEFLKKKNERRKEQRRIARAKE